MNILIANAGSSSIRLRLLGDGDDVVADTHLGSGISGVHDAIDRFVRDLPAPVDAVGHRIVHGGPTFTVPTVIDPHVEDRLAALSVLAPLHQPSALSLVRELARHLPGVPHVACFDTAFHATLPPEARTYALPQEWRDRWDLRRYGFHGLSHAWASRRAVELSPDASVRRVVSCHLGAGASLCAVLDGRSIDTTMGFTPLDGLVMASRAGSVDPGLVLWLITEADMTAKDVEDGLRNRSGLAGLAGGDGDMRVVLSRRADGDRTATAAFDVYLHRLASGVAAMAASLGGVDALVFTGGVGENSPVVRAAACERLAFLGVSINDAANARGDTDRDLSAAGAAVRTLVVEAREDLEIARAVRSVIDDEGSTRAGR